MISFRYPLVLLIGLPVLGVLTFIFHYLEKQAPYQGGPRVGNTGLIASLPEFVMARRRLFIYSVLMEAFLLVSLAGALVLAARPYKTQKVNNGIRKRDIFLCMDTCFYLDDLNTELIDELIEIVKSMDGDRFGISLYSSSSLLLVPMTDDYDYVIMKLEELKEYFSLGVKLDQYYGPMLIEGESWLDPYVPPEEIAEDYYRDLERFEDLSSSFHAATSINETYKRPFLVGDGLFSCMYSFPSFGQSDRSRVIILSTENSEPVGAHPNIRLPEAADYCAKNNVTVYGLFRGEAAFQNSAGANGFFLVDVDTESNYESAGAELKAAVEKTGGVFYEYGKDMTVREIVRDIQKQEAMLVDEVVVTTMVDQPQIPVIMILVSLLAMVVLEVLRRGSLTGSIRIGKGVKEGRAHE